MVLSRVPTHATNNLYVSKMMDTQARVALAQYQTTTGQKSPTYDGLRGSVYRLLTLETEQAKTIKYQETTTTAQISIELMQKSVESMTGLVKGFQSQLLDFSARDLLKMTPDYTTVPPKTLGEDTVTDIRLLQSQAFDLLKQIEYFMNIEGDGKYLFGGGQTKTQPVIIPYRSLDEFQAAYDGNLVTYPGTRTADLTNYTTTGEVTGGVILQQNMDIASASGANPFTFTSIDNTFDPPSGSLRANPGTFSALLPGARLEITGTGDPDTDGYKIIQSVATDGSWVLFQDGSSVGDITSATAVTTQNPMTGTITALNPKGNVVHTMNCSPSNTGTLDFDPGPNTITAANANAFSGYKPGNTIEITGSTGNDGTYYIQDISADGKTVTLSTGTPLSIISSSPGGTGVSVDLYSDKKGFINDVVYAGAEITGNISFDALHNQMVAQVPGAYSNLTPGSSVIINGTQNNNGLKYVASVSEDGRIVTFTDEAPIVAEGTITKGTGVTFSRTYPIGATIDLKDIDPGFNGKYTVIGVDPTGTQLTVRAGSFPDPAETFSYAMYPKQSISANSYYYGDELSFDMRLSDTMQIKSSVNASDSAIEKLIRALGIIAQGGLVDTRTPMEAISGVDTTRTFERINEAVELIQQALSNPNGIAGKSDLSRINAMFVSNLSTIKVIQEDQTVYVNYLENYIQEIETIDPMEAGVSLTEELKNLEYSYAVMSRVSQLSLLNYLK